MQPRYDVRLTAFELHNRLHRSCHEKQRGCGLSQTQTVVIINQLRLKACEGGREVPNHNTDVITRLPAPVIALHVVGTPETKGMSATAHSLIPRDCTEKLGVVGKLDLYSEHEDKRSDSGFRGYIQIFQDKFQNLAVKWAMAAFFRILSLQKSLAKRECYVAAKTTALFKKTAIWAGIPFVTVVWVLKSLSQCPEKFGL